MSTRSLFDRFYFSRADYLSGTVRFHNLIAQNCGPRILEIGPGPTNSTSDFLATLGRVTGLDVAKEENRALSEMCLLSGPRFPFDSNSFDTCVSSYVLEHVANPAQHFSEVARVLRPGGVYYFRTPNLWHYVALASRLLPHAAHVRVANRLRNMDGAHDPWPTFYRANTCRAVERLIRESWLMPLSVEMVEVEPSYAAAHPLLFWPMMAYERTVNRSSRLSRFRANIFAAAQKP